MTHTIYWLHWARTRVRWRRSRQTFLFFFLFHLSGSTLVSPFVTAPQTIVASATKVSASIKLCRVLHLRAGEATHCSARPSKATGGEEEGK